jgi:uncharacterized protein (DUF58 family)
MNTVAATLIPPELRARLRTLAIVPRLPPPPGRLGQAASRRRGTGLEFSQYRAYEPGDEPRRIDWKLYARSDRYFVREAESEAALTSWVVLDASASMAEVEHATPHRSKWEAARALAAATVELAVRQGDRCGLLLVRDGQLAWVGEGTGPRHRDRCLHALEQLTPAGAWPDADALRPAWARIAPGALVLLLGDGFDPAAEAFAVRLAGSGRDVRSIAISDADERQFELRGSYVFEDPETGARVEVDAARARDAFLTAFADARAALSRRLAAAGIRHLEHVLGQPLDRALRVLGRAR